VKDVAKMQAEMQDEKQLREFVAAITKIMLQHNLRLIWKSQSVKFTTDVKGFMGVQQRHAREQMSEIYGVCKVSLWIYLVCVSMHSEIQKMPKIFQSILSVPAEYKQAIEEFDAQWVVPR